MDTILVTGGTGVLGAALVRRLLAAGHPVRVLSRRQTRPAGMPPEAGWAVGDLASGSGLAQALDWVGTVVHCASDPRHPKDDIAAARNLVTAAGDATPGRPPHVVYVSIVGIDRVPFGYYRAKLQVERLLEDSGLPWTVLRATQFHDLLLTVAQRLTRLPVAFAPSGAVFQPVDVGEVADRLAELAVGNPAGRVPDMGGPEVWSAADIMKAVLRASGRNRPVLSVRLPGKAFKALRAGGLLAAGDGAGRRGFEEFLADAPLDDRTYGAAQKAGMGVGHRH